MWLCACDNIMKHFTVCNIQFPGCRRFTLFSCVMTILTSWKGLCGYGRDDMSCQDFCTLSLLRTFPSHYSTCKQHVIPGPAPTCCIFLHSPPAPFNRSLALHELCCIYQNNICFLKIVVNGFQVAGKAQLYFSFVCTFIHPQARESL